MLIRTIISGSQEVIMINAVRIERFFPVGPIRLFDYFLKKDLLERWMSPDDMVVKFREFDPVKGGRYAYELEGKNGSWVYEGKFVEIHYPSGIVMIDHQITDPQGMIEGTEIEIKIDFYSNRHGTKLYLASTGFFNKEFTYASEAVWLQRFSTLACLVDDEFRGNIEEAEPRLGHGGPHSRSI